MEAGSPLKGIKMDQYLQNLTDNLIGKYKFAQHASEMDFFDLERFVDATLQVYSSELSPQTLGRIMCSFSAEAKGNRAEVTLGMSGEEALRHQVTVGLSNVIRSRLSVDVDRRVWPSYPS